MTKSNLKHERSSDDIDGVVLPSSWGASSVRKSLAKTCYNMCPHHRGTRLFIGNLRTLTQGQPKEELKASPVDTNRI